MELPNRLQIGNVESYSSIVKAAQKVLREVKKRFPKEEDMYRLRAGKTIYFFNNKQKMENKIKQLELNKPQTAKPGERLPDKKLTL